MPKFVVYEIWSRARVVEAENETEAYKVGEPDAPQAASGWNCGNWHVVPVHDDTPTTEFTD
jgi:hypothetical protein